MATVKEVSVQYSNDKGKRSYTRVWEVHTETPWVYGDEAVNAVGELILQSYFGAGTQVPLLSISADMETMDGTKWKVTGNYAFPDAGETSENPLNAPPQINWDQTQYTKLTDRDIEGNAVVNSAGDPYQDAQEIDDPRPVLNITRNIQNFSPALAYQYRNAINADPFQGAGPGEVKVMAIKADYQYDQQWGNYWTVSVQLQFEPLGWDRKILDQGFREKKNNKMVAITTSGEAVKEPALLDGTGKVLAVGGQPVYRTHKFYPRLPFNVFA